jgi:hypothetical protein
MAKRNQRLQLLSLIGASTGVIGFAIAVLMYLKIPQMSTEFIRINDWQITHNFPHISIPPSYLIFGFLVVILLFADFMLRRNFYKRHTR